MIPIELGVCLTCCNVRFDAMRCDAMLLSCAFVDFCLQDARQDSGAGVDPELLEQAGSVPGGTQGAGGGDGQANVRESRGEKEVGDRVTQREGDGRGS